MCIFYVFPVYFDGKFVGGALANWYGKLAPVVDQCFESQKHWIFAFVSCEKEPDFIPKNNSRLDLTCKIVWNNIVFEAFMVQDHLSFILTIYKPFNHSLASKTNITKLWYRTLWFQTLQILVNVKDHIGGITLVVIIVHSNVMYFE